MTSASDSVEVRGPGWRAKVPVVLVVSALVALGGGMVDTVRRLDRIEAKIDHARELEEAKRQALDARVSLLEGVRGAGAGP